MCITKKCSANQMSFGRFKTPDLCFEILFEKSFNIFPLNVDFVLFLESGTVNDIFAAWKKVVFGVILFRIFPHSDWMRNDTPYLYVFSPNGGKCRPEWLWIRTLFAQCSAPLCCRNFQIFVFVLCNDGTSCEGVALTFSIRWCNLSFFYVRMQLIWLWKPLSNLCHFLCLFSMLFSVIFNILRKVGCQIQVKIDCLPSGWFWLVSKRVSHCVLFVATSNTF